MSFEKLKELNTGAGSTLGDYKFLYGFVSLVKPKRILDVGTNYGVSAITMAMALRDAGLEESRVYTIDVSDVVLNVARKQIELMNLSGYIVVIHGTTLSIDKEMFFDVVFIDGDHTFDGCLRDFNNVKRRATYVLIHDSVQFNDIKKAVKTIMKESSYEILNINIGNLGEQWSLNEIVYHAFPGFVVVKVKN